MANATIVRNERFDDDDVFPFGNLHLGGLKLKEGVELSVMLDLEDADGPDKSGRREVLPQLAVLRDVPANLFFEFDTFVPVADILGGNLFDLGSFWEKLIPGRPGQLSTLMEMALEYAIATQGKLDAMRLANGDVEFVLKLRGCETAVRVPKDQAYDFLV